MTRVWAPSADAVDLVLPQPGGTDRRTPMQAASGGWWEAEPLPDGTRYQFSLDGGQPLPDPRAPRLPDGPDGPAQAFDPRSFGWTDQRWSGFELPGAVIYELHVGTFTAAGTLDAAIGRLDHLSELGIDVVELLPVASFPGRDGWGYDGVGLFAVHEPYGGPEALLRFVDACHARGIGVCLDVVYNHLGPSGNYLARFGPYFTDDYRTPWGQAVNLDGPGSDEVRGFFLDNAVRWLRDFHIDALRLDAVHALYDERAVTFLEEMTAIVDALAEQERRPLWLIAESDRNDPYTVTARSSGGLGLDAQWADDVHHAWHVLLTGERQGYYEDFHQPGALAKVTNRVFFHDGTWSSFRGRRHGRPVDVDRTRGWRFVVSLQTHDQVGNRARGDRLSASLPPGVLACGAALLLTAPMTPMLFMGEEWGASTPWQFFTDHTDPAVAEGVRTGRRREFAEHGWRPDQVPDPQHEATVERSRLDWSEPASEPHDRLLRWYRELIRLRRMRADLRASRLGDIPIVHDTAARTVLVVRGQHRVAVNLGDTEARLDLRLDEPVHRDLVTRTPLDPARPAPEVVVLLAWDAAGTSLEDDRLVLPPQSAAVVGPLSPHPPIR